MTPATAAATAPTNRLNWGNSPVQPQSAELTGERKKGMLNASMTSRNSILSPVLTLVPVEDVKNTQAQERLMPQGPIRNMVASFFENGARTPQSLVKGLLGTSDFTFSDKMRIAQIPYYLGGAFMTMSYVAGRNKIEAARQAVAVLFYLAGIAATNTAINLGYYAKYGLDLSRRYRTIDGHSEKAFVSHDFPRFDLLKTEDYKQYARGFNIPEQTNDVRGAVHERIKAAIGQSRTLKIILGNLMAITGAAYIARDDQWLGIIRNLKPIPSILTSSTISLRSKWDLSRAAFLNALADPFISRLKSRSWNRNTSNPVGRFMAIYGLILFTGYCIYKASSLGMPKPPLIQLKKPQQKPKTALIPQNTNVFKPATAPIGAITLPVNLNPSLLPAGGVR